MRDFVKKRNLVLVLIFIFLSFCITLFILYINYTSSKNRIFKDKKLYINLKLDLARSRSDIAYSLVMNDKIKDILMLRDKHLVKMILLAELNKKYTEVKHFFDTINFYVNCSYVMSFGEKLKSSLNNCKKSYQENFIWIDLKPYFSIVKEVDRGIFVEFLFNLEELLKDKKLKVYAQNSSYSIKLSKEMYIDISEYVKDVKIFYLKLLGVIVSIYAFLVGLIVWVYKFLEKRLNIYDYLTGVLSPKSCKWNKIGEKEYTLLYIDIDNLSSINRLYGNKKGDFIIQEIAKVIKESVRNSDFICREDDEFLVLIREAPFKNGIVVANKIRSRVKEHFLYERFDVSVSIGVGRYFDDFKETFNMAKGKLIRAKMGGKNRVEY